MEGLSKLLELALGVKNAYDNVQANKRQCKRLNETIQRLANHLHTLPKEKLETIVGAFKETLEQAADLLIEHRSESKTWTGKFRNYINNDATYQRFKELFKSVDRIREE